MKNDDLYRKPLTTAVALALGAFVAGMLIASARETQWVHHSLEPFRVVFVTMFFVSIMVFVIMELPPGDYADRYAFRKYSGTGVNVTEGDIENIRRDFGLDKPAWQRYFKWVGGIVTEFDFGDSFAYETSVNNVLGKRLWLTLAILFSTLTLTYLLAIPIAIYAAIHRHSFIDYSLTVVSYLGLALPNFLLALILLYFSVTLLGSSVGGLFSPEFEKAPWSIAKLIDLLKHLVAHLFRKGQKINRNFHFTRLFT